jgi:murein DD-endopeptidase MepM/ murein hydrolase activator NlpD
VDKSLIRNLLWTAVGSFGTLALVVLVVLAALLTASARQAQPTPAITLLAKAPNMANTATPAVVQLASPRPTGTSTALVLTPTPVVHVVKAGETVGSIALDYGVTAEAIQRANNLNDVNLISIGQALVIPINSPPVGPATVPAATPSGPNGQPVASGVLYACPADAAERLLVLPADPIRLELAADQAYFVANGDLFTAPLAEMARPGTLALKSVMPPERKVGKYIINELVHVALVPGSGDLILLDKSDDIYRYTAAGEWRMEFAAAPIPGQYPDPQYLAVQSFGGNVYALDADLSHIWKFMPGATLPTPYYAGGDVATGVDMVIPTSGTANGAVIILTRGGQAFRFAGGQRRGTFDLGRVTWPVQVFASGERVAVVDGDTRRVMGLDVTSGQVAWQVVFRFPNMQRLRSAAMYGDTLYALAGHTLYVARLSALNGDCPPVAYDNTLYFDGVDVRAVTRGFKLPFPGAVLPDRPRSYPGARRLYRYGVHYGVDLYGTDVAGLGVGSPVLALADGTVTRADTNFVEMTQQEYDAAIKRSEDEHQTPPDLFDKLLGRQVYISHGSGVESHYAHLSAIAAGVNKDGVIQQGKPVGNVGVSGTSAGAYGTEEGAHLHVEIWIKGRYLGQGLSLYETMRLWQAVFE